MSMAQYVAAFDGSSKLVASDPSLLIGDASEQTLNFYWAQNMRGHRLWSKLVPACFNTCARNHSDQASPGFTSCADQCWRAGERAHQEQAAALGVAREALATPLTMRAVYEGAGGGPLPKLVVLLRDPSERIHSSFYEYFQYKARYGDSARGYSAFVEDQLGALETCIRRRGPGAKEAAEAAAQGAARRQGMGSERTDGARRARDGAVRRCALLFESLGYDEERVYYHCDQVLRGMYSVFLEGWLAAWPRDRVLLLLSEDWFERPQETAATVARFLLGGAQRGAEGGGAAAGGRHGAAGGQAGGGSDEGEEWGRVWERMRGAERHREPNASTRDPPPAAKALTDAFYAPFNARLGELMGLGPRSPWEGRRRWVLPAATGGVQEQPRHMLERGQQQQQKHEQQQQQHAQSGRGQQ